MWSNRRVIVPGILTLILLTILVTYSWFITYGSWDLFKGERFGVAYDSLGKSLLTGSCTVEPYTIGWEEFTIYGKTYMYFAIVSRLELLVGIIVRNEKTEPISLSMNPPS